MHPLTLNYPLQYAERLSNIIARYAVAIGQCEYTTQPKGSFWCHAIDTKGAVLLLILMNEFVFIVLCLSFSCSYLVELRLFQSLTNEATWVSFEDMGKFIN